MAAPRRCEDRPRQLGGLLGRQRDVAEDDADTAAIDVRHGGIVPRLSPGVQRQVKEGVELGKQRGIDRQPGGIEVEVVDEATV